MAFGTAKSVLFIEVSSFQGILIREVPLYMYMYIMHLQMYVNTAPAETGLGDGTLHSTFLN